ncbi:hypothetical protein ACIBK8_23460 [Streptomyces sp. NPDC050161]|uniref:hypothetical protein n=1 Tax=Streptomyces sp. NPDC050161 TaxID=3365604 RepID=UPI00379FE782
MARDREARPPVRDGVHVEFADTLKKASGLAVAPVGDLSQARELVADGRADAVLIGRALLRDPYLALRNRPGAEAAWPSRCHRAL